MLMLIAVVLESAGDLLLKKWSSHASNWFFIGGILLYNLTTIFWAHTLHFDLVSRSVSVITIINLIMVVLGGVIFFQERLSPINIAGIALGIVSILLIEA